MMIETTTNHQIDSEFLHKYFKNLVNCFFKVLPMKENNEASLVTYMRSLQIELLGCHEFIEAIKNDSAYLTLLSILQYLINHPEISVREVRREVFKAISICNCLQSRYIGNSIKEVSR